MSEQAKNIRELTRLHDRIEQAEKEDLLFMHAFEVYTPGELVSQIQQGNGHGTDWQLVSRSEYCKSARASIKATLDEAMRQAETIMRLLEDKQ